MDSTIKLGAKGDSAPVEKGRSQRLIGKLINLSHTRPDFDLLVSVKSLFMKNPTEEYMEALSWILRYLKMTPGKGLYFKKNSKTLNSNTLQQCSFQSHGEYNQKTTKNLGGRNLIQFSNFFSPIDYHAKQINNTTNMFAILCSLTIRYHRWHLILPSRANAGLDDEKSKALYCTVM